MERQPGMNINWQRLRAIVKKEFIHIKRDRASLIMVLVMPVFMLLLFGYAVRTDVEYIDTAVVDSSRSQESRELVQKFDSSRYFACRFWAEGPHEAERWLEAGKVKAVLVIPPDYHLKLRRGEVPQVQMLVDGSDPTVARVVVTSGELIARMAGISITQQQLLKKGIAMELKPGIDFRLRVWYNPEMESSRFNIPGLIGLIMQNITIILTAFTLVRERERGTIEQLIVTPVRPVELILGKMLPYVCIGFVDFLLVLVLGVFWFKVGVAGSVALLIGLASLFLICALGVGMFFSAVARTQLQAMQMALVFILPSVLLSGFIFPREAMPVVVRALGALVPLTYFLSITRGIMLRGAGMQVLLPDVVMLAFFTLLVIILSTQKFRKRLD